MIDNKLESTCVKMSSIILWEVRVKPCRQREMMKKKEEEEEEIFGSSHAENVTGPPQCPHMKDKQTSKYNLLTMCTPTHDYNHLLFPELLPPLTD